MPTKSASPSLSPSRANDFLQCPLLFRYRTVDKLPEAPSAAASRGTLVHSVLERLYDLPLGARTVDAALESLPREWDKMIEAEPDLAALFAPGGSAEGVSRDAWLGGAAKLVRTYFTLEDPNRLEPESREMWVRHQLDGGPMLRGIVDRLDVAPDGKLRIVDYKSGKAPRPGYDGTALFQMRFYALVLWKQRGVVPAMLQLVYLGDGQVLRAEPREEDLIATEGKIRNIWSAIEQSVRDGEFRPKRSKLCGWCSFQSACPEFGGTIAPLDQGLAATRLGVEATPPLWEAEAHASS